MLHRLSQLCSNNCTVVSTLEAGEASIPDEQYSLSWNAALLHEILEPFRFSRSALCRWKNQGQSQKLKRSLKGCFEMLRMLGLSHTLPTRARIGTNSSSQCQLLEARQPDRWLIGRSLEFDSSWPHWKPALALLSSQACLTDSSPFLRDIFGLIGARGLTGFSWFLSHLSYS